MNHSTDVNNALNANHIADTNLPTDMNHIADTNLPTDTNHSSDTNHSTDSVFTANTDLTAGTDLTADNSHSSDLRQIRKDCVQWIRHFFEENGQGCNAVIGISGGKDSSVAAALCVEALGKERVIGVMMPCGVQPDIEDSIRLCELLSIRHYTINIQEAVSAIEKNVADQGLPDSRQRTINLPPRIRMSVLYAVSQSCNGRVVNTCNLSENYVGYSTRYGDAAGDFSPLGGITATEVMQLGAELGLPAFLSHKTPSDGLCGKTDEDNLGFTYAVLDRYIRTGVCEDADTKNRIDALHRKNLFKMKMMPEFGCED